MLPAILPAHLQSILYRITSPLALVGLEGGILWYNVQGGKFFNQTLILAESLDSRQPIEVKAGIRNWLATGIPTRVACESAVLLVTPVETSDEAAGLLEWFPETGEEKLRILQEVSHAVNSSLIMEDIFDALGDVLHRHIPYDEAAIVILDDTQNGIKILVRMDADGTVEISAENNAFAGYDAIVDALLRNPVPRIIGPDAPDILAETQIFTNPAPYAMVVPLINKGVVIGLIAMASSHEAGFYQYQQALLEEVSAQLAVAVENAKFYWQTQAQAGREFLINQLTRAIRQSLDIDIILKTAVNELGKVTGVNRCIIRYTPPSNEPGIFQYHLPGIDPMPEAETRFDQEVFKLRKDQPFNPFVLNDYRDCPPRLAGRDYFEKHRIKSLAVFPILIGERLAGTLTLHQCETWRSWVSEDIELLNALAEHLGVALNQAELFQELDRQKQELENALEELQQAQLYLIQSEKMAVLGQFVAGIAHEVNTPLGTMMSNNATLKTCLDKLTAANTTDEQREKLLASMQSLLSLNRLAGTRIQEIVKNLRNFARLDESELKTVGIHEGIDSTLLLIENAMPPGTEVLKEYDEAMPLIRCYPGLLNQVFMNLLVNALHAMADSPAKRITIRSRYDGDQDLARISIADTGKGISPEHLSKVFDPGFTTKGAGIGTGLGLALCYRIVEKHRGRIHVESTPDEGTTFHVEIPAGHRQAAYPP